MTITGLSRLVLAAFLGLLGGALQAGTLGTESGDYNSNIGDPTLVVSSAGANTVTGSIGPSPMDTQDQFSVQIPSGYEVTSISYSGKTSDDNGNPMPNSVNGCGFSSLNQTLGSPASSCTINFNISGNFLVAAYGWTVTVNTQLPANTPPTASSFSAASGLYEDLTYTFATSDFGYIDADGDALSYLLIEALPGSGTLYLDADNDDVFDAGEALSVSSQVSKANLDAGNLQYVQNGSTNTSFQFEVNDGTDTSTGNYIATLSVLPVPSVTLSLGASSKSESVATSTAVTATLSNSYGASVTVNLAFSGTATNISDYTRSGTSIVIGAGNTGNSISLVNVSDALFEGNETVIVDVSSVTNGTESGTQQATFTITDDDSQPTVTLGLSTAPTGPFSATTATLADESGGQYYVGATLSAAAGVTVAVPLAFSGTASGGGTDYSATGSTIVIAAGNTSGSQRITSLFDGVEEGDETVIVDMNAPINGTESGTQQVTITISDEDLVAPTVGSVSVPSNSTYTSGQNLDFTVNTSENVNVNTTGGTPQIALTIGAVTRQASYLSGSGTSALVFRYTVQAGDLDSDGIAVGALSTNGGTLVDGVGAALVTTLNSVGSTTAVLVDAVEPTVSSVSVPSNGTYISGQNLDFTVNLSESTTVNTSGGTPRLVLDIGGVVRNASFLSGSGTSALVFRYTIQSGDLDTDGISVSSLQANGGTLRDGVGNDLDATLSSVGSTTGVLVDAQVPVVNSVSVPANGTYTASQNLDFTLNLSESTTVNTSGGTPQIALTVGSTARQAGYISGSGTSALVFRYTVQSGDLDNDGIAVGALSANGGTLRDAAGNDLATTLSSVGSTSAVLADAVPPSVTAVSPVAAPVPGAVEFSVTFSESTNNISTDDFEITATGSASGAISNVSAATGSSVTVTVDTLFGVGDVRLDVKSGTDLADALGNTGTAAFTTGDTYSINRLPTITDATYNVATGTLVVTGENFSALSGASNDVDVSQLSIVGEAASASGLPSYNYSSPYSLVASSDVEISSDTEFTVQVAASERDEVAGLLTANGAQADNGANYSLVAADNWLAAAPGALDIADAGSALVVSNAFLVAFSNTDTTTLGGTDGSATVTPAGGVAPFDYLWSNGATTATATGLAAGNYNVQVTDATGTVRGGTVVVADPVNTEGSVAISGLTVVGQTLSASPSDSDGISNAVTYQWRSAGAAVGVNASSYTLQETDIGNSITVTASYVDDIGYSENNTSAGTAAVITVEQNALNVISGSANNSGSTPPASGDYDDAGVSGVNAQILALINRAVARQGASADVDETAEIQELVDIILEGQDGDGDGLPNIFEGDSSADTDGDGVADRDDTDADTDGIADQLELGAIAGDSDNDGIVDAFDADVGNDDLDGTDAGKTDENFDGVNDDVDTLDKLIALFGANADGDEYPDIVDADADGDSVTDVGSIDVNADGVIDGQEDFAAVLATLMAIDKDRDLALNHLDLDADNDTLPDVVEAGFVDRNEDALLDDRDAFITDENLLPDTDMDTVPNFLQVDSDGISFDILLGVHSGNAASLDANADGRLDDGTDSDRDGIADSIDTLFGFGLDNDQDDDGIPDSRDPRVGVTPDVESGDSGLGGFGMLMLVGVLVATSRRRGLVRQA